MSAPGGLRPVRPFSETLPWVIPRAAALLAALAISACSLDKESAGLTPAQVLAQVPPEKCPETPAAQPAATQPGVADMLAKARGAPAGADRAAAQRRPDCPPAGRKPAGIETGALPAAQAVPQPAAAAAVPAAQSDVEELYIDFEPTAVTLGDKDRQAAREAIAIRLAGGGKSARIYAARGGSGNWFDQAVIAQKRARVVKELLPNRMVSSLEFDPSLPEDMVRVEFVKHAKSGG
jgi:hypothetical protein